MYAVDFLIISIENQISIVIAEFSQFANQQVWIGDSTTRPSKILSNIRSNLDRVGRTIGSTYVVFRTWSTEGGLVPNRLL